jgi:hypothetical protein
MNILYKLKTMFGNHIDTEELVPTVPLKGTRRNKVRSNSTAPEDRGEQHLSSVPRCTLLGYCLRSATSCAVCLRFRTDEAV